MRDYYHVGLFGQPGSGKSTIGLSFPDVEQHIFGSSEEFTAKNFPGRSDILPPLKWDWLEFLTDEEKAKVFDEATDELTVARLKEKGTALKIRKYRRYIMKLKDDLTQGRRTDVQTVFLDNGTPFFDQFGDWVRVTFNKDFVTDQGNFNSIKYSIKFNEEASDFLELFNSLPCHTVMSFHIAMTLDEESAAKADFMKDTQKGIKHPKEWNAMVTGKIKYALAGKFDFAFYLETEESPGQRNKYIAKLEADSANVGIAKGRLQPFDKPGRIEVPNGTFYKFLNSAIEKKYGKELAQAKK